MSSVATRSDIDQFQFEAGAILEGAWVAGRPRPKGSLKARGYRVVRGRRQPILAEQVEGSSEWRHVAKVTLARACKAAYPDWRERFPVRVPVEVAAVFRFAPPARPEIASHPCGFEGDLDKLCRNLGDAMQDAGLIADDRLIVGWGALKGWADDRGEGVLVTVRLAP